MSKKPKIEPIKKDPNYMSDYLKLKQLGIELINKLIEFLNHAKKMW